MGMVKLMHATPSNKKLDLHRVDTVLNCFVSFNMQMSCFDVNLSSTKIPKQMVTSNLLIASLRIFIEIHVLNLSFKNII